MLVILCHPDDAAAQWLGATMREAGARGIELVTVEQLVFSRRIVHRQTMAGDSGVVELSDGRILRPEAVTGLINRVTHLPTAHFSAANAEDRVYAAAELNAFMLAWLNGVGGRVLNPALPTSLGGATFPAPAVAHCASLAGLPTRPWSMSTSSSVPGPGASSRMSPTHAAVVFDARVFGPILPRPLQEGCRRLASLLGVPLLQVFLHRLNDGGWQFVDATAFVDFRIGGRPLAGALAKALAA